MCSDTGSFPPRSKRSSTPARVTSGSAATSPTYSARPTLAEYADTHDLSTELEQAHREDTTDPDPMVTTSLRLPKSLLDWVRDQAADEGLRPTALIRRWIEQRRDGTEGLAERVRRLEEIVLPGQRS
ncbi:MAG: hypothetical protein ACRDSF_26145 [Pseudonocardiaceae bacterium]